MNKINKFLFYISLLAINFYILTQAKAEEYVYVEYPICEFDEKDGWNMREQKNVEATLTFQGDNNRLSRVAKLSYKFQLQKSEKGTIGIFSEQLQNIEFHKIKSIKLWIKGNNTQDWIRVRIKDSSGEIITHQFHFRFAFDEWVFQEFIFNDKSLISFGGDKNGKMDAPLYFYDIVIIGDTPHDESAVFFDKMIVTGEISKKDADSLGVTPVQLSPINQKLNTQTELKISLEDIGSFEPIEISKIDKLKCFIENLTDKEKEITVNIKNKMLLGDTITSNLKTSIFSNSKKEIEIPVKLISPGVYEISVEAVNNQGAIEGFAKRTINVWEPVDNIQKDDSPVFFGTMESLDRWIDNIPQDLAIMKKAGVRIIRIVFRWKNIEIEKGKYKWDVWDKIFEECKKNNIIPYPMVFGTPDWAINPELKKTAHDKVLYFVPEKVEDYTDFLSVAVKRYKSYTPYWEIWNEPYQKLYWWGGTAEDYVKLLKASYKTIKEIDPNLKVIAGCPGEEEIGKKVIKEAYDDFDIYAFHSHGTVERLQFQFKEVSNLLKGKQSKKEIHLNETGIPVAPGDIQGELIKAGTLTKKIIYSRFNDIKNYMWFIFRHNPSSTLLAYDNFAALDYEGRIRPSVLAYNNAVRYLINTKPVKEIDFGQHIIGYLFTRGQEKILAVWSQEPKKENFVNVTLSAEIKSIYQINMLGGKKEILLSKGEAVIPVSEIPVFLSTDKGDFAKLYAMQLLESPKYLVEINGKEILCPLTIKNIFNDTIEGVWSIQSGPDFVCTPSNKEFSLSFGKSETVTVKILAKAMKNDIEYIPVEIKLKNYKEPFTSMLKIVQCVPISLFEQAIKIDGDVSDWQIDSIVHLKDKSFVRELKTGDVDAELFWNGENDLSAKLYLGWNKTKFYIGVNVKDNIFSQQFKEGGIWQGDSIQLAIEPTMVTGAIQNELGLALVENKPYLYKWAGLIDESKIEYFVKREADETTYEMAIPFSIFNINPENGTTVLFSLLINDNDGRGRKVGMEWGKGILGLKDPALFRPIVLMDKY